MFVIRIAIMGAGLSGLACAITLEKNGIYPTIFEKRSQVGDRFVNGEILLSLISRPVNDSIAYFSEKHGIFLQPASNIKKLILSSEKEEAQITGHLGFCNIRGREYESFENQLARQVKSEIIFNSTATYEQLLSEYTHVIMATGDASYAQKVQEYQQDLTVTLKGATVVGDFDRYTVKAWLNNEFAPKGYAYLIPFSEKEANIVIGFPDYRENKTQNPEKLWNIFYQQACTDLEQNLKVTDQFEVSKYIIGISRYPRIGNTFFTGNCLGSVMPFLGFGQFTSILTGIYAAHDLSGLGSYEQLTKSIRRRYHNSLVIRRTLEQMDNAKLDSLVRRLSGMLGNRLFNTRGHDPLKLMSYLLRPFVRPKH